MKNGLWAINAGDIYFLAVKTGLWAGLLFFGCETWSLGELIDLIDLAVKNGLWAKAKAQAKAKAWQAIN